MIVFTRVSHLNFLFEFAPTTIFYLLLSIHATGLCGQDLITGAKLDPCCPAHGGFHVPSPRALCQETPDGHGWDVVTLSEHERDDESIRATIRLTSTACCKIASQRASCVTCTVDGMLQLQWLSPTSYTIRISSSLLSLHHLHHHAACSPSATSTKHARSFLAQCRLHCHHKHPMRVVPRMQRGERGFIFESPLSSVQKVEPLLRCPLEKRNVMNSGPPSPCRHFFYVCNPLLGQP
jgi:hypothetical protein